MNVYVWGSPACSLFVVCWSAMVVRVLSDATRLSGVTHDSIIIMSAVLSQFVEGRAMPPHDGPQPEFCSGNKAQLPFDGLWLFGPAMALEQCCGCGFIFLHGLVPQQHRCTAHTL